MLGAGDREYRSKFVLRGALFSLRAARRRRAWRDGGYNEGSTQRAPQAARRHGQDAAWAVLRCGGALYGERADEKLAAAAISELNRVFAG